MSNFIFSFTQTSNFAFTAIQSSVILSISQPVAKVSVTSKGAQGIQGAQGIPGTGASTYVHLQSIPAATWLIPHNLGFYPAVVVLDSSNRNIFTNIEYPDINNVKVVSDSSFGGKAYLS